MARPFVRLFALCSWISVCGCVDRPTRIQAPSWNPSGFADEVMEKLDTNGDSQINAGELAAAPGLAFGAKSIDTNSDGMLSRDELIDRFQIYVDRRVGLTSKEIRFLYKGRPLAGAEVRLVPEFFLADLLEPARGTTNEGGSVIPEIANNELRTPVMQSGYYRVEITSPRVDLPPQFNTATTVGVEVAAAADDGSAYGPIIIQLDDKKKTGGKS
jgi:hypothetical protein